MNEATLNTYSKPQLVAMCRAAGLPTGDTARNSKEHYVALLLNSGAKVDPAAAAAPALPTTHSAPAVHSNGNGAAGPDVGAVAAMLAQLLATGAVDENKVRAIVDARIATALASVDVGTRTIDVRVNGVHSATMEEHTHPLFPKVLRLLAAGLNVALIGPAGCGKSHMARQVATALGARAYGELNCTAGASEADLTGYLLPTGAGGAFEYHAAPFVDVYENGGVFMLDEFDGADPNMALVINAATANGHVNLPKRLGNNSAKRHADTRILCGMNTFGTGADVIYQSRNALDGATMDRWYPVVMGYDTAFEAMIYGGKAPRVAAWEAADESTIVGDIAVLADWIKTLRGKVEAAKLRRIVSTRMFQKAIAARKAGLPVPEIKADLLAGWTRDELSKVGA